MATITAAAGGGNWNSNATWTGGVQPTAADDVLLASSSGSVTIPSAITALCRSIDCTGYTNTLSFTNATSILSVGDASGGKATFASTMTFGTAGVIKFVATTANTTYQLTTGTKQMGQLVFQTGSTTTIQFADDVNCGATLVQLLSGKLDMNGKTFTCGTFDSNNATARTLTMGAANITCSTSSATSWNIPNVTNLTVTANTATVNITGSAAIFAGGTSKNWNGLSLVLSGAANNVINAPSSTFANVTRTGTAATGNLFQIVTSLTVSGNLTISGANSTTQRILVWPGNVGISNTVTVNGTVTATNANILGLVAAGSASWDLSAASGGSGDAGNNSGIIFTTPVTQTRNGVSGNWSTAGNWTSRVPLPQDDVLVGSGSSGTITVDIAYMGHNVDFTGFAGTAAFTSLAPSFTGSLTLGSGMTVSGTFGISAVAAVSGTITSNGVIIPINLSIASYGNAGIYTLQDAFNTTGAITIPDGTLDTNSQTVTASTITLSSTGGLTTGSSTINLTSTAAGASFTALAGNTVSASAGTFVISTTSTNTRAFVAGGKTYGTLTYTVAGSTGQLTITGGGRIETLNFSDATNARTIQITSGTTLYIGVRNIFGTSGKLVTLSAVTSGSAATLQSRGNWNIGSSSSLVSGTTGLTVAASNEMNFISAKDITGSTITEAGLMAVM